MGPRLAWHASDGVLDDPPYQQPRLIVELLSLGGELEDDGPAVLGVGVPVEESFPDHAVDEPRGPGDMEAGCRRDFVEADRAVVDGDQHVDPLARAAEPGLQESEQVRAEPARPFESLHDAGGFLGQDCRGDGGSPAGACGRAGMRYPIATFADDNEVGRPAPGPTVFST